MEDQNRHDIVIEELERHLSGNASAAFYKHLDACGDCRAEVAAMTELSSAVRVLEVDPESVPEVPAAFYNRLAITINNQQQRQAWGLFSLSEIFFRRVAFASLMLLAALGSYLVTRETSYTGENAVAIIAQHDTSPESHQAGQDRDYILLTLANYHR